MTEYTELNGKASQYDGCCFDYGEITEAIYVKPLIPEDEGNRYIEALPQPPTQSEVVKRNFKLMPGYIKSVDGKSHVQKLMEIMKLENLRFPLPSDYSLWITIYECMVQSYSRRKLLKHSIHPGKVIVQGEEVTTEGDLVGDEGSAVIGFNMIGESGCGKTSALKIALDYYPKVIRHTNPDGRTSIQIPYILVTCPTNSNFRVLYRNIGRQLDRYLGNPNHECEKEIAGNSRTTLGEMQARVENMIERYAIGMIIFDEVQQMNFNKAENSFNALMVIANDTMVAIGLVGTSEVISNIAKVEQIARRVGKQVVLDGYTTDEHYFRHIFRSLSFYQWFDRRIEFTEQMQHEIFMESHGVIAYIVLIYMMICSEYLKLKEHPEVTLEWIREIISKNFSTIHTALEQNYANGRDRELTLKKEIDRARSKVENQINETRDEAAEKEAMEMLDQFGDEAMKEEIKTKVKKIYGPDFNDERISHDFDIIRKAHPEYDNDKMFGAVVKRLVKGQTDRRRTSGVKSRGAKTAKVQTDPMYEYVMNDIGDPNNPLK